MMKGTLKRRLSRISLFVFSSSILTGCFELNYGTKEEYYDLFDDAVYVITSNEAGTSSSQSTKSLEDDFFNDDSVNDVSKAKVLDADYYEYLLIKPTAKVTMEDFALYVKGEQSVLFEIRLYLVNEIPDVGEIRSFNCPAINAGGLKIDYSDEFDDPIYTGITSTIQNDWQSIHVNHWKVSNKEARFVDIESSNYLVVQFLNNTGYGKDLGYQPVKFSPINLMVSPKNEKYSSETEFME